MTQSMKETPGLAAVRSHLHATLETLVPFMVAFLCDSECAPNVESVRLHTFRGCVRIGAEPHTRRIVWGKERGKAQQFEQEFTYGKSEVWEPGAWTLPKILECVETMTGIFDQQNHVPWHPDAAQNGQKRLFVHFKDNEIRLISTLGIERGLRRFVSRAAEEYSGLAHITDLITPEMLRPSLAFRLRLTSGNVAEAQKLLRHRSADTTRSYVTRAATIATDEQQMRRFGDWFADQVVQRQGRTCFDDAEEVGNGYHCRNSRAGTQPGTTAGKVCHRHDQCHNCEQQIMLATPESAAHWMRWRQHILLNADNLRRNYPERWMKVWAPRLARYEVCLAQAPADILVAGEQLASEDRRPMAPLT